MPRKVGAEDAGESCILPWELTSKDQGTEGKVRPLQLILGVCLAQSHECGALMVIKDTNPKSKSGHSHMDILTAAPGIGNTGSWDKLLWEVF